MSQSYLLVLLLVAQSTPSSGAVVRQANLRVHSNSSMMATFSESVWHNPITNLMQREIEMTKAAPPKVNKVFYVIFAMIFGCCGCDRCFMGQVCLGCVKGLTLGGLIVWHIVDYFVCFGHAISKSKDINMLGYHAVFDEKTIAEAFWFALFLFLWNIYSNWSQAHSIREMNKLQMEQQEALQALLAENGQTEDASLDVPKRHQSLAYIPSVFTKGLRKAGLVTEKPTVPELIAAFQKIDKDGDGQLDREEIREALAEMGAGDDAVEEMIKSADTDGDGKISKDEFLISMTTSASEDKKEEEKKEEEKKEEAKEEP